METTAVFTDGMLPNFQLVEAIKAGSVGDIEQAIARGATLDARDIDGASLLQLAESRNKNDIAGWLIQRGADLHETLGKNENTLLHLAASRGNLGFAAVLLEHGIAPNVANLRGMTPLHIAVRDGKEYFARFLLEHGADANAVTNKGDSPLHIAARRGNVGLIRVLVSHGASLAQQNLKHYTPLHEAAAIGNTATAKVILDLAVRYPQTDDMDSPISPASVALRNGHAETAALIAAETNKGFTQRLSEARSQPSYLQR